MSLKDSNRRFGWLSITNHWLTATLVIVMLFVGFYMAGLPRGPEKLQMIGMHKSIGITILALAILRLFWRARNPMPDMLGNPPAWRHLAARTVQFSLLGLILLMPISGWIMSSAGGHPVSFFGLFTLPPLVDKSKALGEAFHEIHEILAFVIIALLVIHVLAALKHAFLDRDATLLRMLGRPGRD
ncbi:cytochrome b [Acidihalobacter prosperus]|uniref:Cytochrome b n=1 Tax=Acidihalobacter prosperus TaxID=160660 RepID=A0A1A6C8S4_9GAMM|nr:cytochrome b [Acidihalobacter prosperus]OBS10968.1 cytochrome b [Acidihalobacter prosperus]